MKGIYFLNALHRRDRSETSSDTSEVALLGGIIRSIFVFKETLNKSWHVLFPGRSFFEGQGEQLLFFFSSLHLSFSTQKFVRVEMSDGPLCFLYLDSKINRQIIIQSAKHSESLKIFVSGSDY